MEETGKSLGAEKKAPRSGEDPKPKSPRPSTDKAVTFPEDDVSKTFSYESFPLVEEPTDITPDPFCSDKPRLTDLKNAPRKSLTDFLKQKLRESPLFNSILSQTTSDEQLIEVLTTKDPSFLLKGFSMRNLESLQNALRLDEGRRLLQLYQQAHPMVEEEEYPCGYDYPSTTMSKDRYTSDMSQTAPTDSFPMDWAQDKLKYLMGLRDSAEGEQVEKPRVLAGHVEEEEEEDVGEGYPTAQTVAMKKAQRYLRNHNIFELFQFLIAHLLGACPDNPIDFLLELLDRCLLYRSGMGRPPVLYQKKHIDQLFYLMDRMRTGYIEMEQYETGMITLGITSYSKRPQLTKDGLISKEVFIEEAYECLVDLLNHLIKRRWVGKEIPTIISNPPPSEVTYIQSLNEPYFIPPDLILKPTPGIFDYLEKCQQGEEDDG